MADSISQQQEQFPSKELHHSRGTPTPITDTNKLNSLSLILGKSLMFLLLIVAIPFFPSHASNFIGESLVSKSLQLLPLLVIGLAVSYGLFCRRNFEVDFEPSPNLDDSQSSFVSRIFRVCPNFDDGYQNSSLVDDQTPTYCSLNHHLDSDTDGSFLKVEKEIYKDNRSLEPEGDFEISFEARERNDVHAQNFEDLQGASMVLMSNESNELDGYGECGPVLGYSPLGLPLRSLNSGIVNPGGPHFSDGGVSDSSLKKGSLGNSEGFVNEEEFGVMVPQNLEGKFNEIAVSSLQILGHMRTGRMEPVEELGSGVSNSSHVRPLSVDEMQFQSFKSQSLLSTASLSSQASSLLHSSTRLSQSSSVSSEANLEVEELMKSESFRARNPPVSQSPLKAINGDAPLNAFHLRRYCNGSLFSKNVQVSSKDKSKVLSGSRRDDSLGYREGRGVAEKPDVKVLSRGKSVRSIKSSQYPMDALSLMKEDFMNSQVVSELATPIVDKQAKLIKDYIQRDRFDPLSTKIPKRNVDPQHHVPNPVNEKYQKKERRIYRENGGNAASGTEESSESETENFQVTSGGTEATKTMRESGYDPNEVDGRAGEFIANFREQIRLKKVASMDRSRQRRIAANHLS